jgi:GST-like protein
MPSTNKTMLYGCKGCGSAAVEAALQLAGVEYEFVDAIRWEPFKRHPNLEKLNPLGQVPVLVTGDGAVMTESAAMLLFFGERIPGFIPAEPSKRAAFLRWMFFVPANMYAVFQFRDFPARWIEDVNEHASFREKTSARLREYWQILETSLDPAPYCLGAEMTALDLYLAMLSRWTPGRQWITENCPKITASVVLTEQHPIIASVWERNFGG